MLSKFTVVGTLFVLLAAFIGLAGFAATSTQDTVLATVTGKEVVIQKNGESTSSKYLVFTDGETFENTDAIWFGKFNSSDVQGSLHEGERYRLKVYGWRVPVLSIYRNIIAADSVSDLPGD